MILFTDIGLIDENFEFRPGMYVGVEGERIVYIGESEPMDDVVTGPGRKYDGSGKLLMPGFYNGHAHSPMSILRGYGENLPLDKWLNDRIFPFEAKLYGEAVYWSTLLSMAESARYGIVSTTDMYYFLDDVVRAVIDSGEKANVSFGVTNFTGESPDELSAIREMKDAISKHNGAGEGRIMTDACLHAEYTSDEATARAVSDIAKEYGVNTHVHVAETKAETEGCIERHGLTPVAYLEKCGMFDVRSTAAHCVWLNDDDRAILKDKNVTVAHNPTSNLKLVSGICDVPALFRQGINVNVGTDGVSSNNNLDFFEELKLMALLGKHVSGDPALMTPKEVLCCATRAGALSQGREDSGLIKEGYRADMIVVDLDVPNMQPVHDVMNNLIFSASGKDVVMTMVDGQVLYEDGQYNTIDVEKAAAEVEISRKKILSGL